MVVSTMERGHWELGIGDWAYRHGSETGGKRVRLVSVDARLDERISRCVVA